MRKNQKIAIAVFAVVLTILGRILYLSQHKIGLEPPKAAVVVSTTATPTAVSPVEPSVKAPESPTPDLTTAEEPVNSKSGLCKANASGDGRVLISLTTYQQLKDKKAKQLVLPIHQASCFPKSGSVNVRIVSYSEITDRAFDYLGDATFSVKKIAHLKNLEALLYSPEFSLDKLGFKTNSEILDFLKKEGGTNKEPLDFFEVTPLSDITPRNPAASYTFYPYVRIVDNLDKVKESISSGGMKIVDLSATDSKESQIPRSVTLPLKELSNQPLLDPGILSGKKLDEFSVSSEMKESELLLVGSSAFHRLPHNAVQILLNSGISKISILQNGYADYKNWNLETPAKIKKLQTARYSSLENLMAKAVVVDTRVSNLKNNLTWAGAVNVPVNNPVQGPERYDDFTKFHSTQTFDAKYDVTSRYRMHDIKHLAENKVIILIGQNEFDWSPVIFFESFRKVHSSNVYWLRSGFEGLFVSQRLGLLDKDIEKKLSAVLPEVPLASAKDGSAVRLIKRDDAKIDDNPFSRRRHKER